MATVSSRRRKIQRGQKSKAVEPFRPGLKPKLFMGVPEPERENDCTYAWRYRIVNIIGRTPTTPTAIPKNSIPETERFDRKRRMANIGVWLPFEHVVSDVLKINRRTIRRGLNRWAVLEFNLAFWDLSQFCEKLTKSEPFYGKAFGPSVDLLAFEGDLFSIGSSFRIKASLGVYFDVDRSSVTAAEIAEKLLAAAQEIAESVKREGGAK